MKINYLSFYTNFLFISVLYSIFESFKIELFCVFFVLFVEKKLCVFEKGTDKDNLKF